MTIRAYDLPHVCETVEVAGLLTALSPRQRRALRAYVWQVELGELGVTEWLRSEGCPVSARAWYGAGYLHSDAFQAALEAYRQAGQRWQVAEEAKQIARARNTLVRATPRAAERLVEQAEADMSAFWQVQYVWVEPADVLPSQSILAKRTVPHPLVEQVFLTEYLVARTVLDMERLRDPRYARLVKKFTDNPRSGLALEFYDAQRAVESILDRADKATASKGPADDAELTHAANALDAKLAALAARAEPDADPGQSEPG